MQDVTFLAGRGQHRQQTDDHHAGHHRIRQIPAVGFGQQ